jgi:hypothetical protein
MLSITPTFFAQPFLALFWHQYHYSRIGGANTMNWQQSSAKHSRADLRSRSDPPRIRIPTMRPRLQHPTKRGSAKSENRRGRNKELDR